MPGAMAVAGCTAVTRPGPCLHHVMVSTPPVAGVRQPVRQQHCCHPQPHGHQSTALQSRSHSHIIDTILTSSSHTDINTQYSELCSAHIPGHRDIKTVNMAILVQYSFLVTFKPFIVQHNLILTPILTS